MSSQVLITGGSGFIGTHLCRALVRAGYSVRVLDLRRPQRPVEGVEYFLGDVREERAVNEAVKNVSAVFHLAAIASVPVCQQQPYESSRTNLFSTALVLERIRPGTRFVFSSSAAVYGNLGRKGEPILEDLPLQDFLSFYAAQKYGSECLVRQFHRSRGTPAVVFRFFNVYGPGQDPKSPYSGVISKFANALEKGESIRLNGGGEPTRDFVSVHDIVKALILAIEVSDETCDAQPINLGTGQSVTIRELAETMRAVSASQVSLEDAPWRDGDVRHSTANVSRAHEKLGWKPSISLEEGLKELIR
jgi:UDP-glucose 4-epimerase